jgi:hypothetical protein
MKRILKYTLLITDTQTVYVPRHAVLLTAQMQGAYLQLWAMCDQAEVYEHRTIAVYGTGDALPEYPGKYIATAQDQRYVWHVFDMGVIE